MSKNLLPRCVCPTKNGSQCGRRVSDGLLPPMCHVHRMQAQGLSTSPLTVPVEANPEDMYQRLMRDSDPAIRLRALQAWLDYEDKKKSGCDTCRARAEAEKINAEFIPALSEEERIHLADLLEPWRAFKEEMFVKYPHLRPEGVGHPQPLTTTRVVTRAENLDLIEKPAAPKPAAKPAKPELDELVTSNPRLPVERYAEFGIFMLTGLHGEDLGYTHRIHGDEFARDVINGHISEDEARQAFSMNSDDGEDFLAALKQKHGY
jgi:hypothetical protein